MIQKLFATNPLADINDLYRKKEEALNLMDQGLLGGHNKEIADEGDRHSQYSKKGSNSQELPPTLNRQVYFT